MGHHVLEGAPYILCRVITTRGFRQRMETHEHILEQHRQFKKAQKEAREAKGLV